MDETQPDRPEGLWRWLKRRIRQERGDKSDIQKVIDESEEQGLIDEDEGDMIEGIFDLKQTVAREVMIPRTHIVAVPHDCSREQVLTTIIQSGHSRIPVYKGNLDHIVGIIYAKDLLPLWLNNEERFDAQELARSPYFVPETVRIKDLLNELRNKKSHLAVIVDEYGGTSGIVTIEDIIEEIIGEIQDEYDAEEDFFIPQEDGTVLVNAWANLDDFEEYFKVQLPRGGYDTLGGFIIHLLGKVPPKGEQITFGGLAMEICVGDQKRITRVLVTPVASEDATTSPLSQAETIS
ncbi:MAG: hemolysin family protein [Thermodesulfobacteriota bacterium]